MIWNMVCIRYIKSHIGEIIGFGMIGLMVLVWGFFLSENLLFGALHAMVLITASLAFCYAIFKSSPHLQKSSPFYWLLRYTSRCFPLKREEYFSACGSFRL